MHIQLKQPRQTHKNTGFINWCFIDNYPNYIFYHCDNKGRLKYNGKENDIVHKDGRGPCQYISFEPLGNSNKSTYVKSMGLCWPTCHPWGHVIREEWGRPKMNHVILFNVAAEIYVGSLKWNLLFVLTTYSVFKINMNLKHWLKLLLCRNALEESLRSAWRYESE